MTPKIDYRQVADSNEAASAALELLLQQAAAAIAEHGRFVLALSGGETPELLYRMLATIDQDWSRWHLVYADERCLPEDDSDRTSTLVTQCWLNSVSFPPGNHHVPVLAQGADTGARDYAADIESLLPIDMALLGMGEDGHTASLFPGHCHPQQAVVVPVHQSPKPPAERISLSYATLCNAASVCFLVTGQRKKKIVQRLIQGDNLPAAKIRGTTKTVLITDIPASATIY